jgi:SAM-dependent methyltransferase
MQEDIDSAATAFFIKAAIKELGGFNGPTVVKVMDFGCGKGRLVHALFRLGLDAYGCDRTAYLEGCDRKAYWLGDQLPISERLSTISMSPYRLPFDENTFDVVVSTSVLEHAQNTEDCFREIHRVLRPGGWSMHLYPGKWYLPYEPHIFVPLVNFFWPHCPKWWLALWALLGVRNEFQQNKPWKTIVALNHRYCQEGLIYLTTREYRELSLKVFGNCHWPMQFYIENAPGGMARIFKRLPFKALTGVLSREVRMGFLIQQKSAEPAQAGDVSRSAARPTSGDLAACADDAHG